MRRVILAVLAAMILVSLPGSVVAARPTPPQVSDVTARWGMYEWDDGIARCTLIADAVIDPGFTGGRPVYALAYAHFMWVGEGGGTWQDFTFTSVRLVRGTTGVHAYTAFMGDDGYYVVDRVWFDIVNGRGDVISSKAISTTNTCMNG
jgi:hypothetical protein